MAAAMPILTLVSGVVGAIGQLSAAKGQERAAEQQEAAARQSAAMSRRNAALIEQEGMESKRRTRETSERNMAENRARAAASGMTTEGTPGLYAAEQERVSKDELDWLDYSTRSRVAQEQHKGYYDYLSGSAAADVTRAGATSTRTSAVSGLVGSVGQFGGAYNWWQT